MTKVIFMGTPEFSVPILQGLIEKYDVIGVVTQPDKEVGRKQELTFSPIKKVAVENNIKVIQPVKIRNEFQEIIDLKPDIIITCAYGQIIPKEILDCPKYGCINVHASLLPKLRGGAPIHRAIINGDKKTGITIMYMDAGMDTGDIISMEEIPITDDMCVGDLHDQLSILGRELLLKTMPSILNGTNQRIKQNDEEATFGKIIKREDELLDFNDSTRNVFNKIRGLSPFPSCYATLDDKIIKFYKSQIGTYNKTGKPGEIINIYKNGIGVKTNDGEIIITEIKPEGKKRMNTSDYLNGIKKEELIGKIFK